MKRIERAAGLALFFTLALSANSSAQDWLSLRRPSPYAEEASGEATSGRRWFRWSNPLSDWDLRPRPLEWKTPPWIQRWNENSAGVWRRTRRSVGHWASETNESIRQASASTWDAITRAATPRTRSKAPAESNALAPDMSGVRSFLAQPRVKF